MQIYNRLNGTHYMVSRQNTMTSLRLLSGFCIATIIISFAYCEDPVPNKEANANAAEGVPSAGAQKKGRFLMPDPIIDPLGYRPVYNPAYATYYQPLAGDGFIYRGRRYKLLFHDGKLSVVSDGGDLAHN